MNDKERRAAWHEDRARIARAKSDDWHWRRVASRHEWFARNLRREITKGASND